MAGRIILGTANPSLDSNGDPVSGSELTFYRNGTTTLQSVFSAIDLLTPLPNPLPCDASGEFPQVWAPDSLAYSVKWSRPGEADVTYNDIYPMSISNNNFFRFVDVVATSPLVIASGLANGNTIDGQLISTGMRILLTAQTAGAENGIYDAPVSGAASRSADSNSTSSIPTGTQITVQRGSTLSDTIWVHTTAVGFILGTTALTFQPVLPGTAPRQFNWVAAGGTADAITATYVPPITALSDGLLCYVRAASANATTTPTFAPNGLTAHTITRSGGGALVIGDIKANAELTLRYNLANTRWELAATAGLSTRQVLTSGSGATYNTPAGVRKLLIRMAAGGGGGGDNSATVGNGNAGLNSSFNSVTAVGGSGGTSSGNGGAGGTGGTGSPTGIIRAAGALGAGGIPVTVSTGGSGGVGGVSGFAGGYGSGGAGAGGASFAGTLGGGGGGGEYVEFIINSPAASYTYTVGTGGARGNVNATAGSPGVIIVDEIP